MEIRSYRRVFDLERRIYRIDQLRLNPGGVPVRGVAYFLIALAGSLALSRVPLLGGLMGVMPWYVQQLLLPACSASLLTVISVEGRPFHLAAIALLRHRVSSHATAGFTRCSAVGTRWHPEAVLLLPDGSERAIRRFRYSGPGAVNIRVEHELREGRLRLSVRPCVTGLVRTLWLVERSGARSLTKGQVVSLRGGARLIVERSRDGS